MLSSGALASGKLGQFPLGRGRLGSRTVEPPTPPFAAASTAHVVTLSTNSGIVEIGATLVDAFLDYAAAIDYAAAFTDYAGQRVTLLREPVTLNTTTTTVRLGGTAINGSVDYAKAIDYAAGIDYAGLEPAYVDVVTIGLTLGMDYAAGLDYAAPLDYAPSFVGFFDRVFVEGQQ